MECIKRFRDIALDYYDHCEERTLVEMCMTNMIRECRAVLEKLEISQFAQLLQKSQEDSPIGKAKFRQKKHFIGCDSIHW